MDPTVPLAADLEHAYAPRARRCRRANVAIPEQLSFIGFDTDDDMLHLLEPVAAIRLGRASAEHGAQPSR